MPTQETFLHKRVGASRFQVLKTYDTSLAREAFAEMDSVALGHLAKFLLIEEQYDAEQIQDSPSDYADFLWDEMSESAREDGQVCSYFVVTCISSQGKSFVYVSGDWPSAEGYVQRITPQ